MRPTYYQTNDELQFVKLISISEGLSDELLSAHIAIGAIDLKVPLSIHCVEGLIELLQCSEMDITKHLKSCVDALSEGEEEKGEEEAEA